MKKKNEKAVAPSSLWRDAAKRFCKNKTAVVALVILCIMIIAAIFAGVLTPYGPYESDLANVKATPSWAHPFGCDENGRDILTRILYGARISLSVGVITVLISTAAGSVIGVISAYYGGVVDAVLSRLMEMIQSFPSILLAIIFMSVFGRGIENAIIAIAVVSIPGPARIIRSSVLSAKENDYVTAANAIGCTDLRIMFKHILPNILAPIIVNATMQRFRIDSLPGVPGLSGAGRAAAHGGMGLHALLRPKLHFLRFPYHHLPGPGHRHYGAVLQPAGRRPAGRAGSQTEGGVKNGQVAGSQRPCNAVQGGQK